MDRRRLITIIGCFLVVLFLSCTSAFSDIVYTYSKAWPEKTPWIFSFPTGVAIGVDDFGYNSVFVADRDNNRILKVTDYGSGTITLTEWGFEGSGPGQVSMPSAVALGKNGDIIVVDTANHRIQQWSNTMGTHIRSWGTEGTANGQFSYPSGAAVDGNGNVYVADTWNNRIQKFDSAGVFVSAWGTEGSANGQFQNPSGVAVDGSGNVYVADFGNHRVQKLNPTGAFVATWGVKGIEDQQFYYPSGIGVDGGIVYVTDSANNRVQKFTSSGIFSESWSNTGSGNGYFRGPAGAVVAAGGEVYIADTLNCRIQRFDSEGTFVSKWGDFGEETGKFAGPSGIAVDSTGAVYVADSMNNRIQKFTANGQFSSTWGTAGAGYGQFDFPTGVAIDGSGNIYVLDTGNNRIQKFLKTGAFLTTWGVKGVEDGGQFSNPLGIAADKTGNIYVADTYNHRVQKFTTDGVFLAKWGEFGNDVGQFISPSGITIDMTGNVYVADTGNHRVQKFTSDGTFVSYFGHEGSSGPSCYGVVDSCFKSPRSIAISPSGDGLYVADMGNNRVQKFVLGGIQLNSPNGGEHWTKGSKRKITWTYLGNSGILNIILLKGGDGVGLISPTPPAPQITLTSGNGSYDWTVPANDSRIPDGDDYQVALQSVSVGGVSYSVSTANFSITSTQVTHIVTPSTSPSGAGTINPSTPKTVGDGVSAVFTLAPKPGYRVGSVGGTCGGSLSGTKFTTNPVTTDCTVEITFAYKPPAITSLSPTAATVGSIVTVKGKYFGAAQGASNVTIGGVPVTSFVPPWTDTAIKVAVPEGVSAGILPVLVTTPQGTSNAKTFTVTPPVITAISPTSGTVGSVVTIKGKYFGPTQGASSVTIGDVPVTSFVPPWMDTAIKVNIPAGVAAGTASVVVTTPVGASLPKTFTVK